MTLVNSDKPVSYCTLTGQEQHLCQARALVFSHIKISGLKTKVDHGHRRESYVVVYLVNDMLDMTVRKNVTQIGSVKFKIGIQRGNFKGRLDTICEIIIKATYKCVQTVIPRPMLRPFNINIVITIKM